MTPPLAIVQARMGSSRLPRKMLLPLGGKPLVWHAWNAAVQAFGPENVVCAIPASEENDELAEVLLDLGACPFLWLDGPEWDVLGRFHACAHAYRWHPDTVIVRVTPDDPWKDPAAMRRVAAGERLPVEIGGEAFTLAMLDRAQASEPHNGGPGSLREHLTRLFHPVGPPAPPPGRVWTVDTPEDYEAAKARFAHEGR